VTDMRDPEDSASTYSRWKRGDCPCCGLALEAADDGTACRAIGEGVVFCGHCVSRGHDEIPGFVPVVLQSLIEGRALDVPPAAARKTGRP
jgi:hypothetical protein